MLVVTLDSKLAEIVDSLLVLLEFRQVFLESLRPLFKLVLLENDLAQLPLAVFCLIFLTCKLFGDKWLKGLVSDRLTEIDLAKLLVQLLNSLVYEVVHDHAWRLEAALPIRHLADVVALLWQRHLVEALQLLYVFCFQVADLLVVEFDRDVSASHLRFLHRLAHIYIIKQLSHPVLCLPIDADEVGSFGLDAIAAAHQHDGLPAVRLLGRHRLNVDLVIAS